MRKTKPYIVAELSANHLGKLENALELITAAAEAGADAVKFQTYTPEAMVCNPDELIAEGTWKGRRMGELYAEAMTPAAWHADLFRFAAKRSIDAFSSVFDVEGLALLESIGCPCYKIASFEITDLPLIRMVAETGKPMIISTGMADGQEIFEAVQAARSIKHDIHVTLLKCTSGYPAPHYELNLAAMHPLLQAFGADAVGFSDHSLGIAASVAAATLGATIIEKHICLARSKGGPDAAFSLEPHEFKQMVKVCREAAASVGEQRLRPSPSEQPHRRLRRSLWWRRGLMVGHIIQAEDIRTARPARGLRPALLEQLIGQPTACEVVAGSPVLHTDVQIPPLYSPPADS